MRICSILNGAHNGAVSALFATDNWCVSGSTDGSLSFWDLKHSKSTNKRLPQSAEITCINFWKRTQVFVLTTQKGLISFWLNGTPIDSINIDKSILSIEFLDRIQKCVMGTAEGLSVIGTDPEKVAGHLLSLWDYKELDNHKGIVKCLLLLQQRLYSAGYDRRLVAYDASGVIDNELLVIRVKRRAHQAAINCLAGIKVDKDTCLLATGGFDSYIKIWNGDFSLFYRINSVPEPKKDLVFVQRSSQLWVCCDSTRTRVFDVRNGEELTELVTHSAGEGRGCSGFTRMAYSKGLNVLIATTKDFPITLFLGDLQGRLHIWRRCGQSRLTFKKEQRFVGKGMDEVLQRTLAFTLRRQAGRLTTRLRTMLEQGLDEAHIRKNLIAPLPSQLLRLPSDTSVLYTEWLACFTDQLAVNGVLLPTYIHGCYATAAMGFRLRLKAQRQRAYPVTRLTRPRSFTKLMYLESEFILIALCEDSVVYLFRAETAANTKPGSASSNSEGGRNSADNQEAEIESDPFSDLNMKCFRALVGHHSLVTCATVIPEGQIANFPVLITSGWDQRLCFWRLPRGNLLRAVEASMEDEQNPSQMSGEDEEVNNGYAVENAVLDLDYHVGSRTLAYCSANNKVFLQTLSGDLGKFQRPVRVLRGHKNEVNAVCWAELEASSEPTLFSASEDKSIRSWFPGEEGLRLFVDAGGAVTSLCWDSTENLLLASVEHVVKIYCIQTRQLCQQFEGHTDNVNAILKLFDTGQYLTAGLDGRVLLWESRGISSKEPLFRRQSMGTLQTSQSAFDKADSAAARKSTNPVAALLAAARAYKAALKDEHAAANTARP